MARQPMQKAKLLYLQKIFLELTDESHGLTVNEMIAELEKYGISSERKSIYNDISVLKASGLDICKTRDTTVRYYLASRDFEMPELKMLVDAIQSARFISPRKSYALIKKLGRLLSLHDGKHLENHVHILNRVKTFNEQIYYNIDSITNAMESNRTIAFKYYKWKIDQSNGCCILRTERHPGKLYRVSPWALNWSDENYYLIAYESESGMVKHYRLDRMEYIEILDEERDGTEQYREFDLSSYSKTLFSMYGGELCEVVLSVSDDYVGILVDKFGSDMEIFKARKNSFTAAVRVVLSPQFYAWVFGMGDKIKIISPPCAVKEYKKMLSNVSRLYADNFGGE